MDGHPDDVDDLLIHHEALIGTCPFTAGRCFLLFMHPAQGTLSCSRPNIDCVLALIVCPPSHSRRSLEDPSLLDPAEYGNSR